MSICTDWSNHSTAWLIRHRLGLRTVLTDLMDGIEVTGSEAMIEAIADFSKCTEVSATAARRKGKKTAVRTGTKCGLCGEDADAIWS
ncbi:hypothetical protein [Halotia branconii]|uniref:Uncharacterized protein n=1 Tax=Halotia branconii CENA392 TaxID=1539056 RepID=A0AAJ6NYJ6_9CYAN|nr:hypothetical protein [Halotia branconii]WGV29017.1 hypothetical protein QI031_31145 [Halotia branconii CENA392]